MFCVCRYLAWGFADQSFRLCNYDTDRAVFICEPSYLVGEVLTCVCPNPRLVLTAGTSTLVSVWAYDKRARQLRLAHSLCGHTEAVTCLAASPAWGLAVSGSRDTTAILWDLARLAYIKTLPGHAGPVAAVSINELTGDIVSCAGSHLYLWDVNGVALASVNTVLPSPSSGHVGEWKERSAAAGGSGSSAASQILCVAQSQLNEWDRENVIMTGSSDGVVRMWSLDYVEIPVGTDGQPPPGAAAAAETAADVGKAREPDTLSEEVSSITRLAKKMSVSLSGDCLSSLREAVARQHKASVTSERSVEDDPSSDTEDCCDDELPTDKPSDSDGASSSPIPPDLDGDDEVTGSSSHSEDAAAGDTVDEQTPTAAAAPTTLPEINITDDSFVVLEAPVEEGVEALSADAAGGTNGGVGGDAEPAMISGDGYTWSRQLVFRAKLTMHTAFERSDNSEPAAVTALAVSKDHRNLYVGDDRGRVFSWQVSNKPGKGKD
jgi:WD40 repeat protein